MNIRNNFLNQIKAPLILFFAFLSITLLIFRDRVMNISSSYGIPDVDLDGTMAYLWLKTKLFLDNKQDFIDTSIGFPFGFDYTYLPFKNHLTDFLFGILVIFGNNIENILTLLNSVMLTTYAFSGLFTFLLLRKLDIPLHASIVGAASFAFCFDYQTMTKGGVMTLGLIQFIPLIAYLFVRYIKISSWQNLLLFGYTFGLYFGIDTYYSFYLSLFIAIISIFLIYKRNLSVSKAALILITAVFFILLLNIEYIYSSMHLADSSSAKEAGRVVDDAFTYLHVPYYFLPSRFNLLWGWSNLVKGQSILSSIGLGIFLFCFFKFKFNKAEKSILLIGFVCFTLGILLSCRTWAFSWLNDLYFKYFYLFRSVGRFQIFVVLFFSIGLGITVNKLFEKIKFQWIATICLAGLIALEGINIDPQYARTTSITEPKKFHSELAKSAQPHAILMLPPAYPGCEVSFYHRMGQIFTGAKISSILDPKSQFADLIKFDYTNPSEIYKYASKYGFDTIYIHENMMNLPNTAQIINTLKKDPRLQFLGHFNRASSAPPKSCLESSLNISAFRVLQNWTLEPIPAPEINLPYEKKDKYIYSFTINQAFSGDILFRQPYSKAWKLAIKDSPIQPFAEYIDWPSKEVNFSHRFKEGSFENIWTVEKSSITRWGLIYHSFGIVRLFSDFIFWMVSVTFAIAVLLIYFRHHSKKTSLK